MWALCQLLIKTLSNLKFLKGGVVLLWPVDQELVLLPRLLFQKINLQTPMTVHMDGGVVQIDWDMKNTITLSGSAEISFEGEVNLNAYA